jgi:hypothetical protein
MQYKTIVLELLEQQPALHQQLRAKRILLLAVTLYAEELKRKHESWKHKSALMSPASDPQQTASEALELAIEDMTGMLMCEALPGGNEPLSLDDAMAFIRRHTPSG